LSSRFIGKAQIIFHSSPKEKKGLSFQVLLQALFPKSIE
jgi:hypothetical protein